jgi:hypothetical protein
MVAAVIWSATVAKNYNMKENLFRGSILCILFLALIGLNSAKRQPYTTAGTAPQFVRGLIMFYVCVLILILSSNYEDARDIVSIFEAKPSQKVLDR